MGPRAQRGFIQTHMNKSPREEAPCSSLTIPFSPAAAAVRWRHHRRMQEARRGVLRAQLEAAPQLLAVARGGGGLSTDFFTTAHGVPETTNPLLRRLWTNGVAYAHEVPVETPQEEEHRK